MFGLRAVLFLCFIHFTYLHFLIFSMKKYICERIYMHMYVCTPIHTVWIKEIIDILEVKSFKNAYQFKSS